MISDVARKKKTNVFEKLSHPTNRKEEKIEENEKYFVTVSSDAAQMYSDTQKKRTERNRQKKQKHLKK